MNQRIHIINHDDLNDSTDRMIADYEREVIIYLTHQGRHG